jgi:GAF domain-containing protein
VTRRASPEVHADIEDRGLLGKLPDGREVVDALKVTSVAGAPIRTGRQVAGAIVIIQSRPGIHIGFDELGTLTDIADLGGAALTRRWPAVTSG